MQSLAYPFGKLFWAIPVILLAVVVDVLLRKVIPRRKEVDGWIRERRIHFLTGVIVLAVLTPFYFLAKRP